MYKSDDPICKLRPGAWCGLVVFFQDGLMFPGFAVVNDRADHDDSVHHIARGTQDAEVAHLVQNSGEISRHQTAARVGEEEEERKRRNWFSEGWVEEGDGVEHETEGSVRNIENEVAGRRGQDLGAGSIRSQIT